MCGRFVQYSDPEVYASRFDLDEVCAATPQYNLAPTQNVLAIRSDETGKRQLLPLRWGLVPSWSEGPDSRYSMFNARSETVQTKPAYRNSFKRRRCLIPAEGFYEWQKSETGKQPYLIQRRDGQPFAMAGLWETWHPEDGEPLQSCTIIVTQANGAVGRIHDRMPVVLKTQDHAAWLDPENTEVDRLHKLLEPAKPEEKWILVPVSKRVNNARNQGPDLIQAVEQGAD